MFSLPIFFRRLLITAAVILAVGSWAQPAQAGSTITTIKERGKLLCGTKVMPGYATLDAQGHWQGFMVDLCRALATATLGKADRFDIVPLESITRFAALNNGQVDVLVDGATVTLEREAAMNLTFPAVWLYDGQGFMAHHALKLHSIHGAQHATMCVVDGTTTRRNVETFLRREKLDIRLVITESEQGAWESYLKGRCGIITQDRFRLMARMTLDAQNPRNHDILPDTISKEPIGPVVRSDDAEWIKLVRWTILSLIAAEERGMTSQNMTSLGFLNVDDETNILIGKGQDYAQELGIEPGWAKRTLFQLGNYGEIYNRHFGPHSPMYVKRGLNALWNQGGLVYAPPLR